YDREPLRALANAILSAGNTTEVANLSQISVSLSPTQAGAPVFPNILSALTLPPGILFNFTTMNRQMQNAYSEQANLEIERQLGRNKTVSIGYQHVRGFITPHYLRESERAHVRCGGDEQWMPSESELCEQQPVFAPRRFLLRWHACFVCPEAGALGTLPRLVHLFKGARQRRRVLLQFANRQFQYLARLWSIGR